MIHIEDDGKHRVVSDDMNPRIYHEEVKCAKCGEYVPSEEIRYFKDGEKSSAGVGEPRCENCHPDEDEDPRWIDRHSVDCRVCGELVDERECINGPGGEGSVCPKCQQREG